ncbi:l1 transposable element-related [Holotrichia oblita]|uniref:L1 transposable element-related n=1 Tax=Holotrichia oblita TaxID=644536 RepID=A0ACB9THH9_HOLOL|nr:l1 transposable element-related [Holotrichia oblita]
MVLTRAEKDEFIDLIKDTLNTQLETQKSFNKLDSICEAVSRLEKSIDAMAGKYEARISSLENENKRLAAEIDQLEQYSRRNCIRIFGVEEQSDENVEEKVKSLFVEKLGVHIAEGQIDRCHRTGKKLFTQKR